MTTARFFFTFTNQQTDFVLTISDLINQKDKLPIMIVQGIHYLVQFFDHPFKTNNEGKILRARSPVGLTQRFEIPINQENLNAIYEFTQMLSNNQKQSKLSLDLKCGTHKFSKKCYKNEREEIYLL